MAADMLFRAKSCRDAVGDSEQLARVEILGGGAGLHWPDLDADFYVPGLLHGIYGTKKWMAEIGRSGGSVRSAAKKRRLG